MRAVVEDLEQSALQDAGPREELAAGEADAQPRHRRGRGVEHVRGLVHDAHVGRHADDLAGA
eukprot:scaffold79_cov259-Pinguiococcus_pyrenoidosus.AAC.41